jgi:hypothetical protein
MAVQTVNAYAFHVKRLSTGRGDQVYVVAATRDLAYAMLQAQYGADLGTVTGGAALVPGAITTLA